MKAQRYCELMYSRLIDCGLYCIYNYFNSKQMLQTQSVGARMLSKHFHKEDVSKKKEEKRITPEKSASQLLKDHKKTINSPSLPWQPRLGRGMNGSGFFDLTDHGRTPPVPATKMSLAKVSPPDLLTSCGVNGNTNL